MEKKPFRPAARWLILLNWLPLLVYLGVRYLILGDAITSAQRLMLLGAFILAQVAQWQYRRHLLAQNTPPDGTP